MNNTINRTSESDLKTSSLLFDEAPLLVRPEMAKRIGLNESIVVQQVHYWLENKRKSTKPKDLHKERTYRDGRFWCYNSYAEWQEQFPFWSQKTIERIFSKLEEKGILLSGVFNEWKTDRTKWYTIDYDALDTYEKSPKKKPIKENVVEISQKLSTGEDAELNHTDNLSVCVVEQSDKLSICSVEQEDKLSSPYRQLDVTIPTSCRDDIDKLSSPIPKTTTEITAEITEETTLTSSSSLQEENKEEEEEVTEFQLGMMRKSLIEILGQETPKHVINKIIDRIQTHPLANRVCKRDMQLAYSQLFMDSETKKIHDKMLYFANGIILKTENRLVSGGLEQEREERAVTPYTGNLPIYNWLKE